MRGFQLVAKITDELLLKKTIHELGTLLYRVDDEGHIMEIAYFSGSRAVHFIGKVSEELANIIRADGFLVDSMELDDASGYLKIVQKRK